MNANMAPFGEETQTVEPAEEPIAICDKKLNKDEYIRGMYFLVQKFPRIRAAKIILYGSILFLFITTLLRIVKKETLPDGRIVYYIVGTHIVTSCILLLIGILFIFIWKFSLRRMCKLRYEQMLMVESGSAPRVMFFFRDRLEIRKEDVCIVSIEYKNLRKIYYRKPLYLLRFSHMVMGICREDSFSKGNFEIVRQAIRECTKPDM